MSGPLLFTCYFSLSASFFGRPVLADFTCIHQKPRHFTTPRSTSVIFWFRKPPVLYTSQNKQYSTTPCMLQHPCFPAGSGYEKKAKSSRTIYIYLILYIKSFTQTKPDRLRCTQQAYGNVQTQLLLFTDAPRAHCFCAGPEFNLRCFLTIW